MNKQDALLNDLIEYFEQDMNSGGAWYFKKFRRAEIAKQLRSLRSSLSSERFIGCAGPIDARSNTGQAGCWHPPSVVCLCQCHTSSPPLSKGGEG